MLLARLLKNGLVTRKRIPSPLGRSIWGYQASKKGHNWWVNPSLRGSPPRPPQDMTFRFVPLEETIEREGWVERWNNLTIHIPKWFASRLRRHMSHAKKSDRAKQRVHECPAFHVVTTYSKRKGYTMRFIRFSLEPWRDHIAEWLGWCGFTLEEIKVQIHEIEKQLPGSFKQQEHRVIGAFGRAARELECRFKIETTDLDTGKKMIRTDMEYSRRGELQIAGDGEIVDGVAGALAAYQHEDVIRISQERGIEKRLTKILALLAQGKNKQAMKELGMDPEEYEPEENGKDDWKGMFG